MANKYANLNGLNLIKDEYTKINTGFDLVEVDFNGLAGVGRTTETVKGNADAIVAHEGAADPHEQYALDTDLATLQTEVELHMAEIASQNEYGHIRLSDIPLPEIATKAEAEVGANDTKMMTPLRTKQAVNALQAVKSVAGKTGAVALSKSDVGLGNVDNAKQATKVEFDAHKTDFTTLNTEVVEARQGASNLVTNINFIKSRINAIDPFAIFGVAWDKSSNPTLTRTDAAVGLEANVGVDDGIVQNDFDRVQIFGEIHDVEDSLGNVFVRIPKVYIRKTDTPTQKTWQISKTKYKGFYLPWCFWDFEKGRELPYIDFGKYKASLSLDNRLESKPDVPPLVNCNIVQFRGYAQNNNVDGLKGYQQLDVHADDVLQTLFYIEFATLHSQSVMAGFTSGRYGIESELAVISENSTNRIVVSNATATQYMVGQTISVGTARYGTQVFYGRTITAIEDYDADNKAIYFDGEPVNIAQGNYLQNTGWKNGFSANIAASSGSIVSNSNGKYPCMYRGIESPYGDVWQFVDGVNLYDHQAWVCKDASQYASNVFAYPYRQLSYVNSDENGYAKYMGYDPKNPFAEFPVEVGANLSTYYSDYYYQNTGQRIARVGGYWDYGSAAGLSCWHLSSTSSSAFVYFGGRLLKKPL
jgi:hypothetical protein